jgi:hypothetical protein
MVGDVVDFWRVLDIQVNNHLVLIAEMKLPGEALLTFRLRSSGRNVIELSMLSEFLPKGLAGIIYWYALLPFHQMIFSGMLHSIAKTIGKPILLPPKRFTSKSTNSRKL